MRLERINSLEEANGFLPSFISGYNARFALEARDLEKAWCALPKDFDFDYYFATHTERLVKRDHTLQWQGQCLQIMLDQRTPSLANHRISVRVTPEGQINLYAEKCRLSYRIVESNERRSRPVASVQMGQSKAIDPQAKAAAQARRRGWLFTTHP